MIPDVELIVSNFLHRIDPVENVATGLMQRYREWICRALTFIFYAPITQLAHIFEHKSCITISTFSSFSNKLLTRVNVLNANAENFIARIINGFCDRLMANVKFLTKRTSDGQSIGICFIWCRVSLHRLSTDLPCQLHEYNEIAV